MTTPGLAQSLTDEALASRLRRIALDARTFKRAERDDFLMEAALRLERAKTTLPPPPPTLVRTQLQLERELLRILVTAESIASCEVDPHGRMTTSGAIEAAGEKLIRSHFDRTVAEDRVVLDRLWELTHS